MSFDDPRIDLEPLGSSVSAYLGTLLASTRTPFHTKPEHLSLAEVQLADALTLIGVTFEQQVQVGRHWPDFWIDDVALAIEVDGSAYHDAERDRLRDAELRENGATEVLRIRAVRVFDNAHLCATEVKARIETLRKRQG